MSRRGRTFVAAALAGAAGVIFAGAAAAAPCCAVVELRQYSLQPDRFEPFNALFEREFIEPQEAAGMTVIGQFHDLDNAERFVWLRGFPDMERRRAALEAFYGGTLWKALRDEANANFVDTDNVLLLRPAAADSGFKLDGLSRAAPGAAAAHGGYLTATLYALAPDQAPAFPRWFEQSVRPALRAAGIVPIATLETNPAANNFPRLPVREGEIVFIWFARFADQPAAATAAAELAASKAWREDVEPALLRRLSAPPQVLRLEPTARSLLR